jgi:hypothetical protein
VGVRGDVVRQALPQEPVAEGLHVATEPPDERARGDLAEHALVHEPCVRARIALEGRAALGVGQEDPGPRTASAGGDRLEARAVGESGDSSRRYGPPPRRRAVSSASDSSPARVIAISAPGRTSSATPSRRRVALTSATPSAIPAAVLAYS